jgi:hypothetical protein
MDTEPEAIIPLKTVCTKLNCTLRFLRKQLYRDGLCIVEFGPRKRGLRESDYDKLVRSRMRPAIKKEPAHDSTPITTERELNGRG